MSELIILQFSKRQPENVDFFPLKSLKMQFWKLQDTKTYPTKYVLVVNTLSWLKRFKLKLTKHLAFRANIKLNFNSMGWFRSWFIEDEVVEKATEIVYIPGWFWGNLTKWVEDGKDWIKCQSGAIGCAVGSWQAMEAYKCKDKVCFAVACTGVCSDLVQWTASACGYEVPLKITQSISWGCKTFVALCQKNKTCDKPFIE